MLIRLDDVHKAYGSTVIFNGAAASFTADDKVGVIGRNGSGKTTLCRLLLEEEEADAGSVTRSARLRLSYLEQRDPFRPGETVLDFLRRTSGREEWECGRVAGRFKLGNAHLAAPVHTLPGGFQTRAKLASMLLKEPNFLVLDEPTNYLDLTTQLLLERFLTGFRGGFLIVSHDRRFLMRTCTMTLEVERGKLTLYRGDVESYLEYKEALREQAEAHNRAVDLKRKHLQDFIDRNRVRAATASRAQSKIKQRDRLQKIEIAGAIRTTKIRMPPIEPKKGIAFRCSDLAIGYENRPVASGLDFTVHQGERVAVLGDNGEGKTTFLKTAAGALDPLGGTFQWTAGLALGTYAQHAYTAMDPGLTVFEYLEREAGRGIDRQPILDLAGGFLFGGDEVEKKIGVLSGGERSRLLLAGLILGRRPVLLLDEPTNHLDFETVEALGAALREFKGTLFFVSHDRTFVDLVATNILEVKGGSIRLYPGDYASYVYKCEQAIRDDDKPEPKAEPPRRPRRRDPGEGRPEPARPARGGVGALKARVREVEKRMVLYEKERDEIYAHYIRNPADHAPEKRARLDELGRLLPEVEQEWLALNDEMDRMDAGE